MTEFLGKEYVPVEPDFFAPPSWMVAPRLIGCVLCMDYRGASIAMALSATEAYDQCEGAFHGTDTQFLSHGHAYVHLYARCKMWAMDFVCAPRGMAAPC
ncbi:DNA-3-methyladenine glycosylase [Bradyrhizobium sp. Arg62]|nr:DNA-3-methyladenine glycosylase [Bradyrhizobium brasilense]MCC8950414.1 DNA-3-methyladenine glycosylase [Bradyrhizobium brasilense]